MATHTEQVVIPAALERTMEVCQISLIETSWKIVDQTPGLIVCQGDTVSTQDVVLRVHLEQYPDYTIAKLEAERSEAFIDLFGLLKRQVAPLRDRLEQKAHTLGFQQAAPDSVSAPDPLPSHASLSPVIEDAGHVEPAASYDRGKLRRDLVTYFNEDELRTLCFDLNIDFENLAGEGKDGRARELIAYCERNGLLDDLVAECRAMRPRVEW